ncbi:uncharacterized protein LOC134747736 [Cydia strobilella]|uniref:uncharacterized protein LOC134747736 n=1 Tax=Cydia strobilella TaxID=1100964 RepID=UPI003007BF24
MKYAVFFILCCVALAAAAPQFIYPGLAPYAPLGLAPRTVVAGPTVVNGLTPYGLGARFVAPGYIGTTFI